MARPVGALTVLEINNGADRFSLGRCVSYLEAIGEAFVLIWEFLASTYPTPA